MTWLYNNEIYDQPTEEYYGFVYKITNLVNNKVYIGKKLFWFKKTKILKGKKKRYITSSDWKDYFGSSKAVHADVQQYGESMFKREIIKLCKNKGECSYYEAKAQFEHDVLLNPDLYYNDWIICRVHRKHVYEIPTP